MAERPLRRGYSYSDCGLGLKSPVSSAGGFRVLSVKITIC